MLPVPGGDRSCALAGTAKSNKSAMDHGCASGDGADAAIGATEVTVGNQVMGLASSTSRPAPPSIAAAGDDAEVGARGG